MSDNLLETIITRYQGQERAALLPLLWEVQQHYGHIDAEAVQLISTTLRVPAADIYGVISFYSLFHDTPTGETIIRVCHDPACALAGANHLSDEISTALKLTADNPTSADRRYTLLHTTCLGQCDRAPTALISQRGVGSYTQTEITDIHMLLDPQQATIAHSSHIEGHPEVLLAGIISGKAQSLDAYGGYQVLQQALAEKTPESIIDEIVRSNLVGRGGAAFPTGMKWKYTRQSPGEPHYVICNADESEPGTVKDRVLLEGRPHLLLEGMALCAFAIGASKGYLFIRGEYPEATNILSKAIGEAQQANLLGNNILGSGFSFDIELRRGAGAYICGEETALFEAIEGKRGFPRIKPPFPTTHGLFGKPTVVNNVETLCAVPGIVQNGADWFRQWGTENSTGTKLVSISGHVERPGVYEIPFGIPLREVFEHHCQGFSGKPQAILMGGAAGTFLTPDEIDVKLTFEDLRAIGTTLGSGAIMVFNESVDLRDVLQRLGRFFQHESCGKCFPCQLGTQRQMEILDRMEEPRVGDAQRLLDIGVTMTETSLCGLGQTAGMAVMSAMKKWPALFDNFPTEAH